MSYKVNEIFDSIQGEGLLVGKPMNFIRFTGCNLACKWCDTRFGEGEKLEVEEIISRLNKRREWVSLTGGEPMLEKLNPLIDALHECGFKVFLETNSTIYDKKILDKSDYISADMKPPSSGNPIRDPRVIEYCKKNPMKSQIKVVVCDEEDIRFFLEAYDDKYPNWVLQPEWKNMRQLDFKRVLEMAPENVRIIPQMHKVIGAR